MKAPKRPPRRISAQSPAGVPVVVRPAGDMVAPFSKFKLVLIRQMPLHKPKPPALLLVDA
jgi:hypothetical protein